MSNTTENETMDLRIPVTVVFDLFIDNVPVGQAEKAIEALRNATIEADLENSIAEKFDFGDSVIVSSTRWNPVDIKDDEIRVREHAESGGFRAFDLKSDSAILHTQKG